MVLFSSRTAFEEQHFNVNSRVWLFRIIKWNIHFYVTPIPLAIELSEALDIAKLKTNIVARYLIGGLEALQDPSRGPNALGHFPD